MKVVIYTDGSSRGNPGPGGYGAVLLSEKGHEKKLSEGFRKTTNNRMELLSVIKALEALKKPCEVLVFSDSKYVVDSVEKGWVYSWQKKGFAKKKNPDLWKRYLNIARNHRVKFEWVKGHDGNKYNEICDKLAVAAAQKPNLPPDEGYEELAAENGMFPTE
ncbi:ribonuclease HI [Cryomorphaceae bacterium 1068]|nr:ribonuclease HI [Cryomorphaceae bacterium 1068]